MHSLCKAGLALIVLAGGGYAVLPASAQNTTIYSNNFSSGAGAEWSNNATDITPGTTAYPTDAFLGQFGHETTTLTLNGLASHHLVNVSFDLYMIRSMDGNGFFGGGPDTWSLAENSHSLITTNFINYGGFSQAFGGSDGKGGYLTGGNYPAFTGAYEVNELGFLTIFNLPPSPQDSAYHFSFTFSDAASTLALDFIGGQTQILGDESWGVDNVVVKTDALVPEASSVVSLGLLLLLGLGGMAVSRRRKADRMR